MLIPKYSCGTDDISFCFDGELCGDTTCFRHPSNMIHKEIPHSFSKFAGTAVCPKTTEKDKNHDKDKIKTGGQYEQQGGGAF